MRSCHLRLATVLLGVLLILAGCTRATRANFQRVEQGMTVAEVESILGQPTDSESMGVGPLSATTARWEGREVVITIQFVNDKVRFKHLTDRKDDEG